ncbi:hypothetical protein GW17_00033813, partial [Ensete ventricosum]
MLRHIHWPSWLQPDQQKDPMVKVLLVRTIEAWEVATIEPGSSWMDEILRYKKKVRHYLPTLLWLGDPDITKLGTIALDHGSLPPVPVRRATTAAWEAGRTVTTAVSAVAAVPTSVAATASSVAATSSSITATSSPVAAAAASAVVPSSVTATTTVPAASTAAEAAPTAAGLGFVDGDVPPIEDLAVHPLDGIPHRLLVAE